MSEETWRVKKAAGNAEFKKKDYVSAITAYENALADPSLVANSDRSILYANKAICLLSLKRFAEALDASNTAIQFDPDNAKARHRATLAQEGLAAAASSSSSSSTVSAVQDKKKETDVGSCAVCNITLVKAARCSKCKVLSYCSVACQKVHWSFHKKVCNVSANKQLDNGRSASHTVVIPRGKSGITGFCGLKNLGQTCYMASAVQCLAHTPELKSYLVSDAYVKDLNMTNVLGTKGAVATSLARLLKELWFGTCNVVTPTDFRTTFTKHGAQFAGYQQHDAQDFLSWLLDTVHEDVNKVLNKPYVQRPDSDGRPDQEVSEEHWNGHIARNDSFITDLTSGQFKSEVTCTQCAFSSVTFDPFHILNLNIPGSNDRQVPVLFYCDQLPAPMRMTVNVDADTTIKTLKEILLGMANDALITKKNGEDGQEEKLTVSQLWAVDQFAQRFFSEYLDYKPLKSISMQSTVSVFAVAEANATERKKNDQIMLCFLQRWNAPEPAAMELVGTPFVKVFERKGLHGADLYAYVSSVLNIPASDFSLLYTTKKGMTCSVCTTTGNAGICVERRGCLISNNSDNELAYPSDVQGRIRDMQTVTVEFHCKSKNLLPVKKTIATFQPSPALIEQRKEESKMTLDRCLRQFAVSQAIDGEDSFYCKECKKHVAATKTMALWRLPKILIVALKRFKYIVAERSLDRRKVQTHVDFPMYDLDMTKYIESDGKQHIYDLYAVTQHHGGSQRGHYTSASLNTESELATQLFGEYKSKDLKTAQWFLQDDSKVVRVTSQEQLINAQAYILFYQLRQQEPSS